MDKVIKKSIELGFKGKTPLEFYDKWKSTNIVRIKIALEIILGNIFLILSIYYIMFGNYEFMYNIALVFIMFMSIFLLAHNWRIVLDIFKVKNERFEEYARNNKA